MKIDGESYRRRLLQCVYLLLLVAIGTTGVACQGNENDPGSKHEHFEHAPSDSNARTPKSNLGKAHSFVLPTIDGAIFDLSEHDQNVIVINFWATWCAPCLEEIPEFVRLQDELGDKGLSFVGISVDDNGGELVEPFVKRLKVNYPIAMDDGRVATAYKGNMVIPSTFVIDRAGYVRARYIGAVTFETLIPALNALLAETP